jgi:heme/copper-type cytochrome/quinol oxidase subunit 2
MKRSTLQTALLIASMVSHALAEPMTFASPTNIFAPVSTPAKSIFGLSMFVLAVTAAIFVVVFTLLAYSVVKFRKRANDDGREPPQVYGSNQVEIAWTVIPVLVVLTLLVATARVIADVQNAARPDNAIEVTAIGHQFWWEFRYPALGVATANELHVPVSDGNHPTPTFIKLLSADTDHSFWVPRLAGKTDLIPNHPNSMWIDPHETGEIKVALDIEAPESVALNAGGPRPFPRVNSYVLIPVDDGYLVGQIEWLTVERSAFPKRRGMQDFGLVDLPYPLRKMSLNPLGTLRKTSTSAGKEEYAFRRGADALPSIGTGVFLPTDEQLRSIVESGERRRVKIGTSPLAGNAEVSVDPDRLFGRHLAVLGNTGSGKSCSVAGLIRWSLEQAQSHLSGNASPNARFIVLDPNGEYSRAFANSKPPAKARMFKVAPDAEAGELPLRVPLWFWNSAEWCSFTQASSKTQKPTLIQALRAVRDGQTEPPENKSHDIRRFLRTMLTTLRLEKNSGSPWGSFPKPKGFYEKLEKWKTGLEPELQALGDDELVKLTALVTAINNLCVTRRLPYPNFDFTRQDVDGLISLTSAAHSAFGGADLDTQPPDVDAPRPFKGDSFLRSVEATAEMLNVSEHAETLLIRIRSLLANTLVKSIICDTEDISLEQPAPAKDALHGGTS